MTQNQRSNNSNSKQSNNGSGSGGDGSNRSTRKRKKNRKKPKLDPVKYWGDPGSLPVRHDYTLRVADPTAVVRSLGKAPLPGKNSAPELYFEELYNRAASLAQALAIAGGLNEEPESDSAESNGSGDKPARFVS